MPANFFDTGRTKKNNMSNFALTYNMLKIGDKRRHSRHLLVQLNLYSEVPRFCLLSVLTDLSRQERIFVFQTFPGYVHSLMEPSSEAGLIGPEILVNCMK